MKHKVFFLLILFIISSSFSVSANEDKNGSSDHSLFARYPNFYITDQADIEFDEADIIVGPMVQNDNEDESVELLRIEGKLHNTAYTFKGELVSVLQMFRNYEKALKKLNAEILFSCRIEKCFQGFSWLPNGTIYTNYLRRTGRVMKGVRKFDTQGEIGIIAAKFSQDAKDFYVMFVVSADEVNKRNHISQSIIEQSVLDDEKIVIGSVDEIKMAIDSSGKVVLDGIYFDHDKASMTDESDTVLNIIAKYLNVNTQDNFFVVGHTDGSGSYSYNIRLSQDRANAVVSALQSAGIDEARLKAVGVGPVSPATSNRNQSGKALNRRVELVQNIVE